MEPGKTQQQIEFDAVRPDKTVLAITATAMPTRIDRQYDRDGWYGAMVNGTEVRVLPARDADVEATLKSVVADVFAANEMETVK